MASLGRRGPVTLIVIIGLLLPTLAFLQYRWTSELSDLEQLRARTNLDAAAQRLSVEFDAMLAGLYAEIGALADARRLVALRRPRQPRFPFRSNGWPRRSTSSPDEIPIASRFARRASATMIER